MPPPALNFLPADGSLEKDERVDKEMGAEKSFSTSELLGGFNLPAFATITHSEAGPRIWDLSICRMNHQQDSGLAPT